jgi:3-phenylpropionate/cinnamic acid dioxygenase small subunit
MADMDAIMAERECTRLIIRYATLVDASDWDSVAALYVAQGRMSRPVAPDDFMEGQTAILQSFKARPPRKTRHLCANILVNAAGDSATASSNILLFTEQNSTPLVGSYADKLTHTAEGWRFLERRGSLDFT